MNKLIPAVLLFALVGCGGESSVAPSSVSPSATPSLSGTVSAQGGGGIANATVRFLDGSNVGRSTTTSSTGAYRFDNLIGSNSNLAASAACYDEGRAGLAVFGPATLNFSLPRGAPFTQSGSGNTVFDIPSCVTRVRISGTWSGSGNSNFIVNINNRLVVNEILRSTPNLSFSGTYLLTPGGGTVQITDSTFIRWTFTDTQ